MSGTQIQTKRSQAALAAETIQKRLQKEMAPTDDTVGLLLEAVAPGMYKQDWIKAPDAADQQLRRLCQGWVMSWALVRKVGNQITMVVWDRGTLDTGTLPLAIKDGIEGVAITWNWDFRPGLVLEVFGNAGGRIMESARRRAYAADDQPGRQAWQASMNLFAKRYGAGKEVMVEAEDGSVTLNKIYEMPKWQAFHQKPILMVRGGAVEVAIDRVVEPLDILIGIVKKTWLPGIEAQLPGIINRLGLYDGHICFPGYAQDHFYSIGGYPAWLPEAAKVVATRKPEEWVLVLKGEKSAVWIVAMTLEAGLVVTGYSPEKHTAPGLSSAMQGNGYKANARAKVLKWLGQWGWKLEEAQP